MTTSNSRVGGLAGLATLENDQGAPDGSFSSKRGGGVLLGANPSYVVDGVGVERWLPGVICALLRHFWRRFGEGAEGFGRAKGKDRAGFCGIPPLPQEQGHGKDGAPGFSSGLVEFSDIFLHGVCSPEDYFYCALLGVNCMQNRPAYFGEISGLFCWV